MKENVLISVVSPVYMAENILDELIRQLTVSLSSISESYEIVLVEDHSSDNSWLEIEKHCALDSRIKGIKLSKNFGQHYAINAGLRYAVGEWIVVMDCDLQDRPDEIPRLYQKAQEGYYSVVALRKARKDTFLKKLSSRVFYALFSYLTETKQNSEIANFGIYNKNTIKSILHMGDKSLYFPAMVQWVGYTSTTLPVYHNVRYEGKTSYNLKKLLKLAVDNILAFSDKPLKLAVQIGFFLSIVSFIVGLVFFIRYLVGEIEVAGFTSLIISIWFLSGLIISVLGILGLYIGNISKAVKDRPLYIVEKEINTV